MNIQLAILLITAAFVFGLVIGFILTAMAVAQQGGGKKW